jgi:metal-sulfur cluster biosynthetic enzyme
MPTTSSVILDALRGVVDPEMGVNIVDLGLVYEVEARGGDVRVAMTMTTAACPLGEAMVEDAEAAIRRHVPGTRSVTVRLVWEPAWQPSMMSAAARRQLGWT